MAWEPLKILKRQKGDDSHYYDNGEYFQYNIRRLFIDELHVREFGFRHSRKDKGKKTIPVIRGARLLHGKHDKEK